MKLVWKRLLNIKYNRKVSSEEYMLEAYGLKLIKLDLPFRLNHVNCFMAEGENGWTIIDTGLNNKETILRWEKELEGKIVSNIYITHYHPDHFGYAGGLQRKVNARLSMSEIDVNAGFTAWQEDTIKSIRNSYTLAGIPNEMAGKMTGNTEEFIEAVTPYPNVDHYFQEGELVPLGKYNYEVIFTPGHSDGLITFYNKDKNVLLSTDHILPKITPNISHWFHGNQDPLDTYLKSLDKIKKLDADLVIPSHGKPFHGANRRIDEIKGHHEERLAQTLSFLDHQGDTVYDICGKLFQKELTVHEMRFAIGETLAHLEYLRNRGECQREQQNGRWYYTL
ncbi:MBL fold metallo-hydrolase [Virgibacillus alimentarius]|uniref:Glyoxylase-like metal-dependent hydrolase (Beta-lactamase superfamily II) n=1 Tax=Virgibacillus alimentarius TaxID=698769 RepID=A0ABS4S5U0_9BACI|nr:MULTISPECIES: MBL fold metallo-hydrolase [Virgibacillus]MBP2256859.1 glyoxylase-like metal-dependent hydrolase (beta-lactamase superfamily II) [Virgibacillus alimentarius]